MSTLSMRQPALRLALRVFLLLCCIFMMTYPEIIKCKSSHYIKNLLTKQTVIYIITDRN